MRIFTFSLPFNRKLISCLLIGFAIGLIVFGQSQFTCANGFQDASRKSLPYRIEVKRWKAAENIFHSDPRWLGGDGATSVDLGQGRVLWLFGDSLIDLSGKGIRRETDMIRNSIAIQTGYDPTNADMQFFWKMKAPHPAPFFSTTGHHWFWPSSGVMVGKRLLIFLMDIQRAENAFGFEACGWKAVMIENPQHPPEQWRQTFLISPQKEGLIVGSGNPILENGFLHVFATDPRDMTVYLVRWPKISAINGTLTQPQWWAGDEWGWIEQGQIDVKPHAIMKNGQMEFSVDYLPELKAYVQIQTFSIKNPCLAMSTANDLTGPWTQKQCLFNPSEQNKPNLLIYAGKSHPRLFDADLVFTYVVNATKTDRLLNDMSIYFPIFLKGKIVTNHKISPE